MTKYTCSNCDMTDRLILNAIAHATDCWLNAPGRYADAQEELTNLLDRLMTDDEAAILFRSVQRFKHAGFNQYFTEPS
jgi:hypothetical protein